MTMSDGLCACTHRIRSHDVPSGLYVRRGVVSPRPTGDNMRTVNVALAGLLAGASLAAAVVVHPAVVLVAVAATGAAWRETRR